jgi:hypothetical protein
MWPAAKDAVPALRAKLSTPALFVPGSVEEALRKVEAR